MSELMLSQPEPTQNIKKKNKFSENEIEINRKKHKFVFETALKLYLKSSLSIDEFIRCFKVNYKSDVNENDFKNLYSFEINKLKENKADSEEQPVELQPEQDADEDEVNKIK